MSETTALSPPAEDTASYEATFDHYLGEIKRLQRQMDSDQRDIEALQAETRAILADIMETLKTIRS